MKKMLAILMSLTLCLGMAACASSESKMSKFLEELTPQLEAQATEEVAVEVVDDGFDVYVVYTLLTVDSELNADVAEANVVAIGDYLDASMPDIGAELDSAVGEDCSLTFEVWTADDVCILEATY